jgi:chromosome segregation ATPase
MIDFKVRCIKSLIGELTAGKEYLVTREDELYYSIDKNDCDSEDLEYFKCRFEIIEDTSKEVKKVINYRKICNELKSKNELNEKSLLVLKGHIEALEKEKDILEKSNSELQELNLKYYNEYKDLKSENEKMKLLLKLKEDAEKETEQFKVLADARGEYNKKYEAEIKDLKESNKSLASIIMQGNNEIVKLKTDIERTSKLIDIIDKLTKRG